MKREEAILNAAEIANILEKRGLNGAANSLMESLKVLCTPRNPWVKTSDRLPTKDDVDSRMNVMAWHIWYGAEIVDYGLLLDDPAMYIWWAPMPTLPEEVEK